MSLDKFAPLDWIVQNRYPPLRYVWTTMAAFDDRDVAVGYAQGCAADRPAPEAQFAVFERQGDLWAQIWQG